MAVVGAHLTHAVAERGAEPTGTAAGTLAPPVRYALSRLSALPAQPLRSGTQLRPAGLVTVKPGVPVVWSSGIAHTAAGGADGVGVALGVCDAVRVCVAVTVAVFDGDAVAVGVAVGVADAQGTAGSDS